MWTLTTPPVFLGHFHYTLCFRNTCRRGSRGWRPSHSAFRESRDSARLTIHRRVKAILIFPRCIFCACWPTNSPSRSYRTQSVLSLISNSLCDSVAPSLSSWMPMHMDSIYYQCTSMEAKACVSQQKRMVYRLATEPLGSASRQQNGLRTCSAVVPAPLLTSRMMN